MKTVTPYTKYFEQEHYASGLNFVLDNWLTTFIVLGVVFTLWVVSRENKR